MCSETLGFFFSRYYGDSSSLVFVSFYGHVTTTVCVCARVSYLPLPFCHHARAGKGVRCRVTWLR